MKEALARTKKAEADKQVEKQQKAAALMLPKVGVHINSIRLVTNKHEFASLPEIIRTPLEGAQERIDVLADSLQESISSGGDIPETKEITTEIAQGKKHIALATSMLSTIGKVR